MTSPPEPSTPSAAETDTPFAEVFGLAIGDAALASLFKLGQAALRRPGRWVGVSHPILMDRLDPFWRAGLDSQMHHAR